MHPTHRKHKGFAIPPLLRRTPDGKNRSFCCAISAMLCSHNTDLSSEAWKWPRQLFPYLLGRLFLLYAQCALSTRVLFIIKTHSIMKNKIFKSGVGEILIRNPVLWCAVVSGVRSCVCSLIGRRFIVWNKPFCF